MIQCNYYQPHTFFLTYNYSVNDQTNSVEMDHQSFNEFQLQVIQADPKFEGGQHDGTDMDGYEDVSDQACYYKSLNMKEQNSSMYTRPYHHDHQAEQKDKSEIHA